MGRKLTTEEWINKARQVHGNRYDYSKVDYITNNTKVIILCPEHGKFETEPRVHLITKGCPQCSGKARLTKEQFISKAVKVHDNKYDYSEVKYNNTYSKVIINCPEHGSFKQTPNNHLNGKNCPECAKETRYNLTRSSTEEFTNKSFIVHGNKYDYSKVNYLNTHTKVKIICPIHGEFEQKPNTHLTGKGCPSCAVTGFDTSKPGILYYLKIKTEDNKVLYKIGITNRTVNERFNLLELSKIEIIKQEKFENGQEAYDKEQEILKKYKEFKYIGPKILDSGNTELFTKDVLEVIG